MTRRFLFLQGPPGPFFRQLGAALRCAGCAVDRVNFNGGDQLDWRAAATAFRDDIAHWPARIAALLDERAVTDLVLFGDCRPLHRIALEAAARRGVTAHVFEEGYVRPDWVTLERGGVNGHSTLPRDADFYRRAAIGLPQAHALPQVPARFRQRAREAAAYYGASVLLAPRFPGYRSHRPYPALTEATGWLRRSATHAVATRRSRRLLQSLVAPYFVVPLQLDSDYQLRLHSPFGGMVPAAEAILRSFAEHAPPETVLIVKQHPLDNSLLRWRDRIARAATMLGVGDRVRYLESGDIAPLVGRAQGVVTVNSTTGTLALGAGVPVKVLGRAIYDIPGITHQGPLDGFWATPQRPHAALFDAFRRVLADRCLLRGGFSSREGRAMLIEPAVTRMLRNEAMAAAPRSPAEALA